MEELLKDYRVIVETRVDWGDMDAFQHVNNAVYFRYLENARVEYGARAGIVDRMATEGVGPILAWADCRYIRPVAFPDTVRVGVRVAWIEDTELAMEYEMESVAQKKIVAAGNSLTVYYDYRNSRREEVPDALRKRIEALEGRPIPGKCNL